MSDVELRTLQRQLLQAPDRDLLSRLATAFHRTGDSTLSEWLQFISGYWTLDPPTKPGGYFTKDHQHQLGGILYVYMLNDELVVAGSNLRTPPPSERWQAYWWSESMPSLPIHTTQDKQITSDIDTYRYGW